MKGHTDYLALYRDHGLPLAEAYYLAEFNYFITNLITNINRITSLTLITINKYITIFN